MIMTWFCAADLHTTTQTASGVDEVLLCMCVFQMISHVVCWHGVCYLLLLSSVSVCMCMWLSLVAGGIIGSPSGIYLDTGNNGMSQWDVLVNGLLLMFQVIVECSCHCFHPDSRLPCHSCWQEETQPPSLMQRNALLSLTLSICSIGSVCAVVCS